jgi:hypothetical protein
MNLHEARACFQLLRLPYQWQLGPIFAWGFLLGEGRFASTQETLRFLYVFLIFHIGAFGGLTALNSFYDRDQGPIGGLWNPPPPPKYLWHFAWGVQLFGLVLVVLFGWQLTLIYAALLVLSLLYSHPRTRWKGHALGSLLIVVLGQGVLDCLAGAYTVERFRPSLPLWFGTVGATFVVAAFYPLTQLYQIGDDTQRGDKTLAATLFQIGGRDAIFRWAGWLFVFGTLFNGAALHFFGSTVAMFVLFAAAPLALIYLWHWEKAEATTEHDFKRVHFLMRAMALGFAALILWQLMT